MKSKVLSALFGLAALWGASFLFIRIASPVLGPFLTIQGRVTIAAIALLIYTACIGRSADFQSRWKQYLILGALNAAIPFMLIATAAIHLNASMSAILNSLTPVFSALVAWGWIKETLTLGKWVGIIVGIIGVAILVGWSSIPLTFEVIVAVGLSILSTVSYGFGGVYAKKALAGVPPLSVAVGQQIGASILLIPFTLFNLPTSMDSLTPAAIFSVVGVAIFCTAIAYPLFFYLISNAGPTKTQSVTLLIPLFGMIWGVVFLDETITAGMITGLIVILGSIFLIYDIRPQPAKNKPSQKAG
ncbi:DMT family transporter [Brevibacillus brevis]|uniref:DMT family transporter n=1 Tax=Brevibacillus brevis TaxID=1393 RepID=UPI00115777D0|nr:MULTISPECIES: DMT family transporter [Bacillales]TQR30213.1 DMT family transporter [Lysinibacillus sp. SDF0063]UIO43229.1 DMT family transporter [Brevibacillus brevis]WJQ81088.1 DMT family transporter [Brevibacillus brevis]